MTSIALERTTKTVVRRTKFLDHIRLSLTALVIFHHSAIMFGATGDWYLKIPTMMAAQKLAFSIFTTTNQTYFMGFFFLLAGYFSVASFNSKGPVSFMWGRLVRLGIPILVYGYVIGPMTLALAGVVDEKPFLANWMALMRAGVFEIGPLWFTWALLLFSFAYVVWRLFVPQAGNGTGYRPSHSHLLIAAVFTGVSAFAIRLWFPLDKHVWALQVGYFASYVVLFVGGCAFARSKWLVNIDADTARPWRIVSWVAFPLLFIYAIVAGVFKGAPFNPMGGLTLPSLAYAIWEPFVAWGIILSLLYRFGSSDKPSAVWDKWSDCAYAAYILHPPVVVALGVSLANVHIYNIVRAVIAGSCAVVLTFLLARLVRKLPGASKIL